jgi:hypothetical protein
VDQVEGLEPIHENWGLSLGDEIDENGDPPRIWHPYGQYPVSMDSPHLLPILIFILLNVVVVNNRRALRSRVVLVTSSLKSSA